MQNHLAALRKDGGKKSRDKVRVIMGYLKKKRERARVERCQRLKQQTNKPCVLFSVLSVLVVIHVNVFPTLEMEI